MRHLDVSTSVIDWLYFPLKGTTTDSQSTTSPSVSVVRDPAHQVASDPVTCPTPEADLDCTSPPEPTQCRGSHGDLSSCEAVLAQKLKSLELQNTLPGQADLVYHKSLALDPSCLLTPPNTPQGMELAELEADLREGARQQKGNWTKSKVMPTYCTLLASNLSSSRDKTNNTRRYDYRCWYNIEYFVPTINTLYKKGSRPESRLNPSVVKSKDVKYICPDEQDETRCSLMTLRWSNTPSGSRHGSRFPFFSEYELLPSGFSTIFPSYDWVLRLYSVSYSSPQKKAQAHRQNKYK